MVLNGPFQRFQRVLGVQTNALPLHGQYKIVQAYLLQYAKQVNTFIHIYIYEYLI